MQYCVDAYVTMYVGSVAKVIRQYSVDRTLPQKCQTNVFQTKKCRE